MKKLLGLVVCVCVGAVLSVGSTGCKKKDTNTPAKKTDVTAKAESAKVTLEAGKDTTDKLTLNRGSEAKNEATLKVAVEPADKGVTASLDPEKVKGDAKEATLKIMATKETKAGKYEVTVSGKSDKSADFKTVVTVTVSAAKKEVAGGKDMKFGVKADPEKELSVKQGKSGTVTVTLSMGADLHKATVSAKVTDAKGKEAKGVTAKVDPDSMKKGGDAKVTVEATADAMPGDYDLVITSAAEGGTPDASVDTKITVKVEKK